MSTDALVCMLAFGLLAVTVMLVQVQKMHLERIRALEQHSQALQHSLDETILATAAALDAGTKSRALLQAELARQRRETT